MIRTPLRPLARILQARARGENPDAIERENIRLRHEAMRDKDRQRAESRLVVLALAFLVAFLLIGTRMGMLAASEPVEPLAGSTDSAIVAQRADIVDRNGRILATNLVTSALYAQPPLMVDKPRVVRELARATLQRAGYRVFEANDGHEAVKLWVKHRDEIDLLLTDMVMPNGMTGCELSQRLLADQPDLPVIYSSGYSIELTAPGFDENERLVFLSKPYLTGQLLAVVDRCLKQAG